MAIGKSKKTVKGRKGGKKKAVDPFTKKEWFDIRAPNIFQNREVGKTLVNRSTGQKPNTDELKTRIVKVSLADLINNEEHSYRNIKLKVEDVQGKQLLTNFRGMELTTDKLRVLMKKWQTTIDAYVDVKTTDGYVLRVFAIAFTKKISPIKKHCYAQHSKVRIIRKKMKSIITREIHSGDLKQLVEKLIPDSISSIIERETCNLYPLKDIYIRKVKVVKSPKLELSKLNALHADHGGHAETGVKVERE